MEGFDIEWMMRQAGMVAAPTPVPEAAPWLPTTPRKEQTPQHPAVSEADAIPEPQTDAMNQPEKLNDRNEAQQGE
jgi:hypothetical protein